MDSNVDRDERRPGDEQDKKRWETPVVRTEDVDETTEGGAFAPIGDDALYSS